MARSDLFSAAKNAQQVYSMIKDVSEDEGLDGWVQEKIIKANDYLNTIREYLEGKQVQGVDEADMSRRGFLKGLGAVALGAVAGNALAGTSDPGYVKKVQEKHFEMAERNPKYAKEHQALGLLFSRGITGNAAETNKQWAIKTAELLQKYGVTVNEGVTENNQRVDSLVTDSLKIMKGGEVSDAVRALTTVLGNREYNSRRGFYNFYIKQMIDMYGQQGVAEGSRNAYLKHNNLVDIEKPLAGLKSEFEKFLQTHDPEEKQKYQQGIKQRIKTRPMAGPKGVLPEQGMTEGVGSAINVSEALQAMKQLANTTNRHISTKTYNGLLDWDDGNLAEIVVNAIKACATLSNYYKNNNQLDYAQLINKLQSELIAFKNGDAFVTIKQLSQGTLSKINFQQGVSEGAKVDRMVKHIEKSEKKLGKSKDEAENIAWATANKRGMLNNKNKKA
jgi:hypothetical protein